MSPPDRAGASCPNLRSPHERAPRRPVSLVDPKWAHGLAGGGEMGARIRSFDWSSTPLGPIGEWPSSLREAVSICLRSRFQLAIYWGPKLILLYNDAERDVLGTMHPGALGRPAAEILGDNWDVLGPMMHGVLEGGEATWSVDQALRLNRRGLVEESFFTYSYSPIPDGGGIGGVLLVTFETTERVLADRRLRTLRELAADTANAHNADEACVRAAAVLAGNRSDVPFSLLFLTDRDGTPRLCASSGVAATPDPERWPLREVASTQHAELVDDVPARLPLGEMALPRTALVLPIAQAGQGAAGCLVAGVSDFGALDEAYRGFLDLVAGQIATVITGARALRKTHEELEQRVRERTRELSRANARLAQQIAKRQKVEEARTALLHRLVHAQEEERRRIARELHDDFTQRLAVLAIDAGRLEQLPDCPQPIGARARKMHEQLVALSEGVHSLSRQLHPSMLDDLGLVDALSAECARLGKHDGIAVCFRAHDVPTCLSREVALCLYRVAQEALRNVSRHARTRRASVHLFARDEQLVLCVRDRGVGFEIAAPGKAGLGLASMRERVRLVRARLAVRSRPGQGTTITVRVPLYRSLP
jgi:signal transduction histidine kinase